MTENPYRLHLHRVESVEDTIYLGFGARAWDEGFAANAELVKQLVKALGCIAAGELGPNAGEVSPDLSQAYHAQGIALAALEAARKAGVA